MVWNTVLHVEPVWVHMPCGSDSSGPHGMWTLHVDLIIDVDLYTCGLKPVPHAKQWQIKPDNLLKF